MTGVSKVENPDFIGFYLGDIFSPLDTLLIGLILINK
jgi:hypothetical protein